VARVVAFIPDLLFGSGVVGAIEAAGHEATLVGDADSLRTALSDADALVVDLTADAGERIEATERARPPRLPTLAFYAHVEADVRTLAVDAGFDPVVPRSRMARDGPALIERLLSG
jgi:hypothetical protein